MPSNIEALAARVEALRAEIVELDAITEPTDEQNARFDAAITEADEAAQALETARAEAAELAAKRERIFAADTDIKREAGFTAPNVITSRQDPFDNLTAVRNSLPADVKSRAASAIESIPSHEMSDAAKEGATRAVESKGRNGAEIARHVLMFGSDAYRSGFEKFVANPTGFQIELSDAERAAFSEAQQYRAAMSLTDANGGYLVPFTLDPTVHLTNDGVANPFRQQAKSVQITTDNWNGVTSAGVTAEWLAEGTEAADASPTFGNTVITPGKAAAYVFGSYEALADSGVASQIGSLIADAKDRLEGAAFALGSGSGRPHGVIDALIDASKTVTSTTTDTFAVADVYKTLNAVPARYRAKASWFANVATINAIRAFDTYGGSAFWANLGAGAPEQLLGLPIFESSDMDGVVNAAAENYILGCVDMSEYLIVDRVGTTLLYEPIVKGSNQRPTGQAGWFAFWRVGADLTNTNAGRVLNVT